MKNGDGSISSTTCDATMFAAYEGLWKYVYGADPQLPYTLCFDYCVSMPIINHKPPQALQLEEFDQVGSEVTASNLGEGTLGVMVSAL